MKQGIRIHVYPTALEARNAQVDARRFGPGLLQTDARFVSFRALVNELMADAPYRAEGDLALELLAGEAVEAYYRLRPQGMFAPIAGATGFARALRRFLDEVKSAGLSPRSFGLLLEQADVGADKHAELLGLYESLEDQKRARGLLDRYDVEQRLLDILKTTPDTFRMLEGVSEIVFHGIVRWDPFRFHLVRLLSFSVSVCVELPFPEEASRTFRTLDALWRRMEAFPASCGNLSLAPMPSAEKAHPEMGDFLKALFAAPLDRRLERIHCFQAFSRYREVEEMGTRILKRLDQGCPPGRIGVLFRSLSVYGPIVEDVFSRYGIPFLFRRGNPLRSNSLVKFALSLLEILDTGLEREAVLKALTSTYAARFWKASDGHGPSISPADLEEAVLGLGVIRGASPVWQEHLERALRSCRGGDEQSQGKRVIERLLAYGAPLLGRIEELRQAQDIPSFLQAFREILDEFQLSCLPESIEPPFSILQRDRVAVALLYEELERVRSASARTSPAASVPAWIRGKHLLLWALDGRNIRPPRYRSLDLVPVLSVEEAVCHRFSHVFIGGLVEREFPRAQPADPFLTESERRAVNRLARTGSRSQPVFLPWDAPVFEPASHRRDRELVWFHLASATAEETLTFSFPSVDLGGEALLRSPLVDDVCKALTGKPDPVDFIENRPILEVDEPVEHTSTLHELLNKTVSAWTSTDGFPSWTGRAVRMLDERMPGTLDSLENRIRLERVREEFFDRGGREVPADPEQGAFCGILEAWDPLIPPREFTITELERYGACPFAYFCGHVLGLAVPERTRVEEDPVGMGAVAHRILAEYHRRGPFPGRTQTEARKRMRDLADAVLNSFETEHPDLCGDPLFWTVQRQKLLAVLDAYVAWDPLHRKTYTHVYTEAPIGRKGAFALPDPEIPQCTYFLKGRMDRLDQDPATGYIRVWDYKWSGDEARYGNLLKPEVMGVTSFQVPLYLLAAAHSEERFRWTDKGSIAGGYILLRNIPRRGKPSERIFEPDAQELSWLLDSGKALPRERGELIPSFQKRVCAVLRNIRKGLFPPVPEADRSCDFCSYASICRYLPAKTSGREE